MFKINIYAFCVYALRVSATQGHNKFFLRNPKGAQSGCNTKDRKNRHPVTPKLIIITTTYFKSSVDKVQSAVDSFVGTSHNHRDGETPSLTVEQTSILLGQQTPSQSQTLSVTLRLIVSQSVCLGVEPCLGLMTRYLFRMKVTVLSIWGALSDERSGLSFVSQSRQ
jgi:hypothetical protein